MTLFRVTRIVTFRPDATQASPCSSVWQNGDAGLTVLSELVADRAGTPLVADGRLESVDAARGGIGGDNVLLQTSQLLGVLGAQGAPLGGGARFTAEGAQLDSEVPMPPCARRGCSSRCLRWSR